MKVVTVVGARPQFIKLSAVSPCLRKKYDEIIVHTGQHFDYNMSEKFFEELSIPEPDYNLGISGGSHAQMTGKMMMGIEEVLIKENPDWLLLFGDTNSTLAAALAAAKLHIPICHVEAGSRSFSATNPEEINRICADHISSLLCPATRQDLENLKREGLAGKAVLVGNTMYDSFCKFSRSKSLSDVKLYLLADGKSITVPGDFYYMTCHREENTSEDEPLLEILTAMNQLDAPTIYPVHPRNRERALRLQEQNRFRNIYLTEPVGYLDSACLTLHTKKIVTDSGGLQTEAFFAQKKCLTILDFICWPATMVGNRNELSAPKREEILNKLGNEQFIDPKYQPFGDGHAGEKIVWAMTEYDKKRERI